MLRTEESTGLFRVRLWVSSECRVVALWRTPAAGQSTEAVKAGQSDAAGEGGLTGGAPDRPKRFTFNVRVIFQ